MSVPLPDSEATNSNQAKKEKSEDKPSTYDQSLSARGVIYNLKTQPEQISRSNKKLKSRIITDPFRSIHTPFQ